MRRNLESCANMYHVKNNVLYLFLMLYFTSCSEVRIQSLVVFFSGISGIKRGLFAPCFSFQKSFLMSLRNREKVMTRFLAVSDRV